ncbi:MAG: hypothetical protein AAGM21_09355 [Pseudomonadota bacterium]
MVGSSKILTVSYGTFSCTLEGFDDPFSTMRSIAEYFRDLAADDRYFGAEPPTPDAEMLHRIAEREIQRRVEARVDGEDVILRQIDSGLVEDESDLPASEAMAEMADIAVEDPQADAAEIVAAAPAAVIAKDADAAEVEAEGEAETFEEDSLDTVADDAVADDDVTLEDTPVEDAPADAAEELSERAEDAPVAEADAGDAPDEDVEDTIEDKLNRIRAVVERTRSRDLGAAAYAQTMEPEDADDEADAAELAPGFAGDLDAALITQVMAEEDAVTDVDDIAAPASPDPSPEDLADLAALDGADGDQPEIALDDAFETAEEGAETLEDETEEDRAAAEDRATEDAVTRILTEFAPEEITAQAEARAELPSDEAQDVEDDVPEMVFETEETDAAEAAPEETDAPDTAQTDDIEDDDADDDADDDLWERDFDAEAEEDIEGVADDASVAAARDGRTTSKSVHLKAPDEESDRLETETETAFKEDAGSRRRSAIAHLKAAVAATRADKILSRVVGRDHAGDPEEQKDYREDLSKVVKPSRPLSTPIEVTDETPADAATDETLADAVADEAHSEPEDEKPSPLMLVSELRVGDDASGEDLRPRRVARDDEPKSKHAADDSDFGAFADRMGVSDLTDLMEAAAAYTAHVEGQPHFSRPQIMRRVATIDPSVEDSREAGLRAFGQLLRQGRIIKLQRGQFTIADGSRFKPEQRIAGE